MALAVPAFSQVSGGSVSGRVTDATGANIPNARIELENTETGQRLTVTTDASGTYTFNGVPAGRYRVITTGVSAASVPTQEVTIDVSRPNTINISIPSGPGTDVVAQTENVPVTDRTPTIQDVWNTRYVHYFPNSNFIDKNGEAYGAYNLSILNSAGIRVSGSNSGPAFAGQRPESNLFHIQGIDNQNRISGGPLVYLSNEATTEFSVMQNQNSPLFGHTGGANFNSIMRTGTNRVHGSVYNYLQNRWFNAVDRSFTPFGYNQDNQPRYDQNRLGATFGAPIVPRKVFFFGNFEYIPLGFDAPIGGALTAPTAAGLNALAGVRGVSATNLGILQNALGSNAAADATGTQVIGGANIPVGLVNNVQRNWQNQRMGSGSLDFNMSDKDQLHFRYVHNEVDASWSGNSLTTGRTPNYRRSLLANVSHFHTFGNMVTNELRLGYNRLDAQQSLNGFTGPLVSFSGGLNLGPSLMPGGVANSYHLADTLAFRVGGHDLKVGFDGRRSIGYRNNFGAFNGMYTYSSVGRFLQDLPPDVASQRAFGSDRLDLSNWSFFGFVSDTWKVAPNVTLDLGARYQYTKIPNAFRNQGLGSNLSVPGLIEFNDPRIQRWNFSPYVGIAVSPWSNRTVIRAGAGLWYDANYWQPFTMGWAPQLASVATGNLSSTTAGFLGGGGLQNPGTGRAGVSSFIGDQKMPYNWQWNAGIQQAFWRSTSIEFKYMGNRGVHQPMWRQLNYSGVTEANSLPIYASAPSQAQLNALPLTLNTLQNPVANQYAQAGFTNPINTIDFGANSWYHGAQANLIHTFSGGLQVNANYTWSRWEDDATGTPLDIGMPTRMRGRSLFDQRHSANITGMFEVAPLFRNSWSVARNVFADFNLAATYSYRLANQLTPVSGNNALLANNSFGTPVIFNPNGQAMTFSGLTPLQNSGGNVVGYSINNPNAQFIQPSAGVWAGGNRRGIMLDDLHNIDVAAVKRFNVGEYASFELRGEAYNVLNRTNRTGFSARSMGTGLMPMLGMIPGTVDVNNLSNLALLPGNNRMMQFALRVVF